MTGPVNILRMLREHAKDYDCSVCGANHARSEIRLVGKIERSYVVRVTCSQCKTAFKLLVMLKGEDEPAVSRVKEEPPRRRRPPITADDVLDAHETLRAHTSDVAALFKRSQTRRLARRA
ncbi:MAG: hypothetical protein A3H36_07940 [Chloroflexi bacterium RIFCSPLOWO2_02_FULL_71_16]|nr:MAG: hypothetical protein A2082_00505 [Chloroflexi bacterium GWC2_70_10]OGO70160.1 MAG: hypothetical protein A3H36_07940 [Chloroflexi bacterium RIFCSPLOWO2_02_FULL_71_16]